MASCQFTAFNNNLIIFYLLITQIRTNKKRTYFWFKQMSQKRCICITRDFSELINQCEFCYSFIKLVLEKIRFQNCRKNDLVKNIEK